MDARCAPQRIGEAHLPDESPYLLRDLRPSGPATRPPMPIGSKPAAMPADDSLGLDDGDGTEDARANPIEPDEQNPVRHGEAGTLGCFPTQHQKLMTQDEDFRSDLSSRSEPEGH